MSYVISLIILSVISIIPDMMSMDRDVEVKQNTKTKDRTRYDEWGNAYTYDETGNRYDSKGSRVVFMYPHSNVPQEQNTAHSASHIASYHSDPRAISARQREMQEKVRGRSDFAAYNAFVAQMQGNYTENQASSEFSLDEQQPQPPDIRIGDALSFRQHYPSFKHDKELVVKHFQALLYTETGYAISRLAVTLDNADFAAIHALTQGKLHPKYQKKIDDHMVRLFEKDETNNPLFEEGIHILKRREDVNICIDLLKGKRPASQGEYARMAALARRDIRFANDLDNRMEGACGKLSEMEARDTLSIMDRLVPKNPKDLGALTVSEKNQLRKSVELYHERFQSPEFQNLLKSRGAGERFKLLMSLYDQCTVEDITGMEVADYNLMVSSYGIDRKALLQPLKEVQQIAVRQQALTLLKDCRHSPELTPLVGQGVARALALIGKETMQEARAEIETISSIIQLVQESADHPLLKNLTVDIGEIARWAKNAVQVDAVTDIIRKFKKEARAIETRLAAAGNRVNNSEAQLIEQLTQELAQEVPFWERSWRNLKKSLQEDAKAAAHGTLLMMDKLLEEAAKNSTNADVCTMASEKNRLHVAVDLYQERFQTPEFQSLLEKRGDLEKFKLFMSLHDQYTVENVTSMEVSDYNLMVSSYGIDRKAFLQPLKEVEQIAVRQQALALLKDCRHSPELTPLVGQGVSRALALIGMETLQAARSEIETLASCVRLMQESSDPLLKSFNIDIGDCAQWAKSAMQVDAATEIIRKFKQEARAIGDRLAAHESFVHNSEAQLIGELAQMSLEALRKQPPDAAVNHSSYCHTAMHKLIDLLGFGEGYETGKEFEEFEELRKKEPEGFCKFIADDKAVYEWLYGVYRVIRDKRAHFIMLMEVDKKEPKEDYERVVVEFKDGRSYSKVPKKWLDQQAPATEEEYVKDPSYMPPFYVKYRKISEKTFREIHGLDKSDKN